MLWEVDVDRYDTDSLPLSMGRFIARMGGGGGGRLGAVCSWHAPIRGQGQQNASWPRRGARGGARLHLSCPHSFRVSFTPSFKLKCKITLSALFGPCLVLLAPLSTLWRTWTLRMEAPEKAICLPIPWARLLTDRDLWRDWRLSQDASLPCLQIA